MKVSTVQGKLGRIEEQIALAACEIEGIDGEIETIEDGLTKELAKVAVDDEAVATLEGRKSVLTASRDRLTARITALQGTIPGTQTDLDAARLQEAIKEHANAVDKVNQTITMWREQAENVAKLEPIAAAVREDRKTLAEITSKIAYLSEILGESRPVLSGASHLTRDDVTPVRGSFRRACLTELSAYSSNSWDAKLKKLNDEKREQERLVVREHKRELVKAAGW